MKIEDAQKQRIFTINRSFVCWSQPVCFGQPRRRGEFKRKTVEDHRASLSTDFSTYEYAVVEWVASLVQKTSRSRIHGSLAAWNASIFRKETVSPLSFPESDGKTTSGGSIATPESLRNEPGNRKRASILVFAAPPVLLLSICAPCFYPTPGQLFSLLPCCFPNVRKKHLFSPSRGKIFAKQTISLDRKNTSEARRS